jgi:hypothetical protein
MKLSAETIEVLKNFSGINQSLLFKEGNSLSTMSNIKTILASADIAESFPKEFAIYDLNKFLAKHSLYKDCNLVFEDDRVVFKSQDNRRSDYIKYCSPKVITSPQSDKKLSVGDPDCTFDLSQTDLDWQRKSAGISGSPHFVFKSDGKQISLISTDVKDNSSDVSETKIADGNGSVFEVVMKVEYFKMLDGDYSVEISRRGLARFTHKTRNVVYYVAIESAQSKFD